MADKVIVLSARPAKVKRILEINFEETTPIAKRTSPKFSEYYTKIWSDIDE